MRPVKLPTPKSSDGLLAAVRNTFAEPNFVTLSEVRDSTGFDSVRSADALALGMYQSRGRELWGFEFKVSRSDWLCELRQPAKAESWMRFCDRWAVIVPDAEIVNITELPVGWGLGIPQRDRVKWIVAPPKLTPMPLERYAFCAFVYAVMRSYELDRTKIEYEAFTRAEKQFAQVMEEQRETAKAMVAGAIAFEAATGLDYRYSFRNPKAASQIGKALRALERLGGSDFIENSLTRQAELLEQEAAQTRERLVSLKAGILALSEGQSTELLEEEPTHV